MVFSAPLGGGVVVSSGRTGRAQAGSAEWGRWRVRGWPVSAPWIRTHDRRKAP